VDTALSEIERLPGQHLYFLDDHLFGHHRFASALFTGMSGMGRLWQAAGTVRSILKPGILEKAVQSGLRSLFVGFETLSPKNLVAQRKGQNLNADYTTAIKKLHDHGVMVNASFVFGMDDDDETVFDRTVDWALGQGVETATFHILTPYPGTPLYTRMLVQDRLTTFNWDRYDTRHAVFKPIKMTAETLEAGYWRAYRDFYRWGAILKSVSTKRDLRGALRHLTYTTGWKKFEPLWDIVINLKRVGDFRPLLENVLGDRNTKLVSEDSATQRVNESFPHLRIR
jgi:radical SAM superfamily enzyme YgiQ (UPF0313 family)